MLELVRRIWITFLSVFAVLAVGGCAPLYYLDGKKYQLLLSIVLWSLALICLVVAIIALTNDIKDTRKKDKEAKAPSIYEDHDVLAI
jgi:hypothetical protein